MTFSLDETTEYDWVADASPDDIRRWLAGEVIVLVDGSVFSVEACDRLNLDPDHIRTLTHDQVVDLISKK